ncbi:hypothetical protein [Raoultella ornithinolytica]|uniref:hypothetical protein n=1 Tax=Raoultella ornithinolytica TaxID=54291 RepID=UPI00081C05FF|nr:hypothetical protein [Raoultella ornithinolytica]
MTSKLNREQLRARAVKKIESLNFAITQSAFTNIRLSLEEELQLAEFALAAMDSEPVAYMLDCVGGADYSNHPERGGVPLYRHAQTAPVVEREPIAWLNDACLARGVVDGEAGSEDAGPGYIPVYREASPAQPAPVVPKSISVREAISALESEDAVTTIGQAYKMGWNACRAAMLNGGKS